MKLQAIAASLVLATCVANAAPKTVDSIDLTVNVNEEQILKVMGGTNNINRLASKAGTNVFWGNLENKSGISYVEKGTGISVQPINGKVNVDTGSIELWCSACDVSVDTPMKLRTDVAGKLVLDPDNTKQNIAYWINTDVLDTGKSEILYLNLSEDQTLKAGNYQVFMHAVTYN